MASYTVEAGDSWATIAQKLYGDQRQWDTIGAANNFIPLHAGMTISVPGGSEISGNAIWDYGQISSATGTTAAQTTTPATDPNNPFVQARRQVLGAGRWTRILPEGAMVGTTPTYSGMRSQDLAAGGPFNVHAQALTRRGPYVSTTYSARPNNTATTNALGSPLAGTENPWNPGTNYGPTSPYYYPQVQGAPRPNYTPSTAAADRLNYRNRQSAITTQAGQTAEDARGRARAGRSSGPGQERGPWQGFFSGGEPGTNLIDAAWNATPNAQLALDRLGISSPEMRAAQAAEQQAAVEHRRMIAYSYRGGYNAQETFYNALQAVNNQATNYAIDSANNTPPDYTLLPVVVGNDTAGQTFPGGQELVNAGMAAAGYTWDPVLRRWSRDNVWPAAQEATLSNTMTFGGGDIMIEGPVDNTGRQIGISQYVQNWRMATG